MFPWVEDFLAEVFIIVVAGDAGPAEEHRGKETQVGQPDAVPEARFANMWKEIDKQIDLAKPEPEPAKPGFLRRLSRVLERYRSQIITGAVSAGAVAALALVLRGGSDGATTRNNHEPIDVRTVSHRPAEIEALDTPDGTSTVFNLDDEDGSTTTVIWVTPEDTVEGI